MLRTLKLIRVSMCAMAIVVVLPSIASADVVWPSLVLAMRMDALWVIGAGLLLELPAVKVALGRGWRGSIVPTLVMNVASSILGLSLVPSLGIAWEAVPGPWIQGRWHIGTFNPLTWAAMVTAVAIINTTIEGLTLLMVFGFRASARNVAWIGVGNLASVALAFTSLWVIHDTPRYDRFLSVDDLLSPPVFPWLWLVVGTIVGAIMKTHPGLRFAAVRRGLLAAAIASAGTVFALAILVGIVGMIEMFHGGIIDSILSSSLLFELQPTVAFGWILGIAAVAGLTWGIHRVTTTDGLRAGVTCSLLALAIAFAYLSLRTLFGYLNKLIFQWLFIMVDNHTELSLPRAMVFWCCLVAAIITLPFGVKLLQRVRVQMTQGD